MNRFTLLNVVAGITGIYEVIIASRVLTLFNIYFPAVQHRAISLVLVLTIIYLSFSPGGGRTGEGKKSQGGALAWYDVPFWLAGVVGAGFVALFYDIVLDYGSYGYLDTVGVILAALLCVALLEAVRRTAGMVLAIVITASMAIALFQNYLPGLLNGKGFAADRLLYGIYVGSGGIFGLPLGTSTSILIVFLVYARLLQQSGVGEWFTNIALALTGKSRGGPAKAAVVSSGLFGMISGSAAGNVATTGAFTIPLMMRVGYRPAVAAGIESVAATGGTILPPVMGATAFVMAEWIGVGYGEVVRAAFIPAILYYCVAFASVHFEALRRGLKPMPREEIPAAWETFKEGWYYPIPLLLLIYFLVFARLPADIAGMVSLPFLIGSSFFSRDRKNWLVPKEIFFGLAEASKTWVIVASVTGAVGMLIGSALPICLAIRIPNFLLNLSGGNLLLTLLMVGISSLFLGMGLDALPGYLTLATLAAPVLITLGLSPMAAHLFVVYWGTASFITPPVAIAVFVACGLSGSKLWETGWEAVKIGICIYLVPIAFAYDPAIMLMGTPDRVLISVGTALIGAVAVAAGMRGYALRAMNMVQRLVFVAAGALLIAPDITLSAVGAALGVAVLLWQLLTRPARELAPVA
ncbi:MAG: TRAP transporter fused permease subunit [Chloroflexi bacterium]|nr:TRAP transporter fused permease subunit [Chloroflexota bacterium]